jgi:hypothetical protein
MNLHCFYTEAAFMRRWSLPSADACTAASLWQGILSNLIRRLSTLASGQSLEGWFASVLALPFGGALVREWTAIRAFILVPPVTSSERRLAYPNLSFD